MVRNKLAAAILGVSLALPGVASALGVGDYTLKSYLNQPLKLDVGLIQTKDLTTDEIVVGLASPEEFEKVGVDYVYFLQDLQFSVEQGADGGMQVRVSSQKAVTEPFLNFILQVQWPGGRALREYTILLDPPVYKSGDAPTATSQPVTKESAEPAAAAPAPTEPASTSTGDAPPPLVMSDGSTFDEATLPTPEPASDTATGVVLADESGLPPPPSAAAGATQPAQPDSTVATQSKPAAESASSRSAAVEGEYKVVANDTMWDIAQRHQGTGTVQQTMLAIQRANPDAFIKGNLNLVKKGAVLRIPGEGEVQQINRGEASAEFAAQTKAWREMLDQRAVALPSDKATLEASAPVAAKPAAPRGTGKGEVTLVAPTGSSKSGKASGGRSDAALENDLAIAKESISKATRENKALEKHLGELDTKIKASEKQLTVKNDRIAGLQEELGKLQKEQGVVPAESAAEAKPETPVAETPKPKVKKEPIPAEPVVEKAAEPASPGLPLIPIIAGAAVLLGGGAFLFLRRRKSAAPTATDTQHDEQVEEDLAQLQDLNLSDADDQDEDLNIDMGDSTDAGGDAGGGDPLGEADMYVAYGRFQQAADILYAALQREPERGEIRVKLAEVYAEMGDNDAAGEQARAAASSSDAAVRQQAEAVLSRIGGGSASGTGKTKAVSAPAMDDSLSLDDLAQEFSTSTDSTATATTSALDDMSFDLDDAPSSSPATTKEEALDFSLDDVDIDLGTVEVAATPSPVSSTEVRPKADFGEMSFDDAGFDDLSLPEDTTAQAPAADELTLEDDFSLEESADLPSLDDEPDFAATSGTQPKLTDKMVEEVTLAPAPAPAAEMDLEAELADLETGLQAEENNDDFDFLTDSDENATKLDLAKAYIEMSDIDGARDILNEVLAEGNAAQKSEAGKLLGQIG